MTQRFYRGLIGRLDDGTSQLMTYAQFQERNAKNRVVVTMEMLLASQLKQIPGCSEEAAKAIARTFGTISNLISFVNEVGSKMQTIQFIADIRRTTGQGMRVGKNLAEYIVKIFSREW